MKEIAETRRRNLSGLIDEHGLTSVAHRMGKPIRQINDMVSTPPRKSFGEKVAREMEIAFGLDPGWLDTDHSSRRIRSDSNTSAGPTMHAPVPLISWVQAGEWCGIVDNFAPGDADMWLPVPRAHGPNAYALRVRGVSMEPRYRDGSIIFVDPGKQADHGSNIVVRMDNESEATFKQLVIEGDNKFLRALNPDWPGPKLIEIKSNATICGVVIGQFIPD